MIQRGTTLLINVSNFYNSGEVSGTKYYGGIIGWMAYESSAVMNSVYNIDDYFVGNVSYTGSIEVIEDVKTEEFVELLNSYVNDENIFPSNWLTWILGDDNYPTIVS